MPLSHDTEWGHGKEPAPLVCLQRTEDGKRHGESKSVAPGERP